MIRRILPLILVFLVQLIDCSVLPVFVSSPYMPIFTLIMVSALGLLLGRSRGVLYGLIGGILMDISVSTPMGVMTVMYAAVGYVCGWFARRAVKYPYVTLIAAAICFVAVELIMTLYLVFTSGEISGMMFAQAGLRMLIDVMCVEALLWPLYKLLRLNRQRFDML